MPRPNIDPNALKEAQRLLVAGQLAEAREICEAFIAAKPKAWPPHLLLARIALKSNQKETLDHHIVSARDRGAPELSLIKFEEQIAHQNKSSNLQIQLLDKIISAEPDNVRWQLRRISALHAAHRYPEFFSALETLVKQWPETKISAKQINEITENSNDEATLSKFSSLVTAAPQNVSLRIILAIKLAQMDKMDDAWSQVEAIYETDKKITLHSKLTNEIKRHITDTDKHHERLRTVLSKFPLSSSLLWLWATVLNRTGRMTEFRELVEDNWHWASKKNPPFAAIQHMQNMPGFDINRQNLKGNKLFEALLMENDLAGALSAAPTHDDKALIQEILNLQPTAYPVMPLADYTKDVITSGPERPNGTVIIFGGLADKASLPFHVLDVFFAELEMTAIYLSDFKRLIHLKGIKSLGNTLDETLEALTEMLAKIRPEKPLYTFGNSAGGMASIVYGVALNAKSTLVFSPHATIKPEDIDRMNDGRGKIVTRRIFRNLDHTKLDLQNILQGASDKYEVTVYVGADSKYDRPHAEMLDTMPRTSVNFVEGVDQHNIFTPAAKRFGMLEIMRQAFKL